MDSARRYYCAWCFVIWSLYLRLDVRCWVGPDGRYSSSEPEIYMPGGVTNTAEENKHTEDISPENVMKILDYRLRLLDLEGQRDGADLMKLEDFIEMTELDCKARLYLLHAMTAEVLDFVTNTYQNVTSIGSLYWMLPSGLKEEENSWVWLTTTYHQRLLQRLISYFSKAAFFALEDRLCLSVGVRKALVGSVGQWKQLQIAFTSLAFNGFAFGLYGDIMEDGSEANKSDAAAAEDTDLPAHAKSSFPRTRRSSFSANGWMTVLNGNLWSGSLLEFFENHAARLTMAIQESLVHGTFSSSASPTDGSNPAGGTQQEEALRLQELQGGRGMFSNFEVLRRQMFQQWAVDKGLLRGLLRHVLSQQVCANTEANTKSADTGTVNLPASLSLADFGAGAGKYAEWLNDTGLVTAFALDGGVGIAEATQGQVMELDIAQPDLKLWRTFDWVLCLEVAEHVPSPYVEVLLDNIGRHVREGLIMSWSPDTAGIGHVSARPPKEWHALVSGRLGLVVDEESTSSLRAACQIDYLAQTVTVFRRVLSSC